MLKNDRIMKNSILILWTAFGLSCLDFVSAVAVRRHLMMLGKSEMQQEHDNFAWYVFKEISLN